MFLKSFFFLVFISLVYFPCAIAGETVEQLYSRLGEERIRGNYPEMIRIIDRILELEQASCKLAFSKTAF